MCTINSSVQDSFQQNSQDYELCDKAKVDRCRRCKKFVCVLFCSIQDPSSDNEIHRIHKPGDRRCNKQNIIESTKLNLDHSESDFNPNISQSNGFMSSRFMCPSCENNYATPEDLNRHIAAIHNGLN